VRGMRWTLVEYERLPDDSLLFEVSWNERTLKEIEKRGYVRADEPANRGWRGKGGIAVTMKAVDEHRRGTGGRATSGSLSSHDRRDDAAGNSPSLGPPVYRPETSLGASRWG
jgi:hypothetical protein